MKGIHISPRRLGGALIILAIGALGVVIGMWAARTPAAAPASAEHAPAAAADALTTAAGEPRPAPTTGARDDDRTVGSARATQDPCALVSQAEAEKLSGETLKDAGRSAVACSYGPLDGGLPKVEVYVGDAATRYLTIEQNGGREFRTLSGVAEEAFISDAAGLLFVKQSDQLVAVRFVTLSDEKTYRTRFEDLAGVIARRTGRDD